MVKLDKAMYGLIKFAKMWYKELSGFLLNNGFKSALLMSVFL